jgi:hypothetical protein
MRDSWIKPIILAGETSRRAHMSAIRVLLENSIDYAGLFPPAGLGMDAAVTNYHQYRAGKAAWALGRFILPATRLPEFEQAAKVHLSRTSAAEPWLLSVLAGADLPADLERVAEFNRRHAAHGSARIDALEQKVDSDDAIGDTMHLIPRQLQAYLEIPIDRDPGSLIETIGQTGACAKVRSGGVTRDAFPSTAQVIRFVQGCARAGVPFKATAGLHHPLRAQYRLTYAPDSPIGPMFGFLNLFLATAFLRAGVPASEAAQVLEEESPSAFQFDSREVSWRGHRLGLDDLSRTRQELIISFGSCSFTEPIDELHGLSLLEPRVQQA